MRWSERSPAASACQRHETSAWTKSVRCNPRFWRSRSESRMVNGCTFKAQPHDQAHPGPAGPNSGRLLRVISSDLIRHRLPSLLARHLKDDLVDLPGLKVLISLRRILQRHRPATQERDLLLLFDEHRERVFKDAAHGAPSKCHGDVLAVAQQAV